MEESKWPRFFLRLASYILVAAIAVSGTLAYHNAVDSGVIQAFHGASAVKKGKLEILQELIQERFIGGADPQALEDAAAAGMVSGTGDRWSYYIPASEYAANREFAENSYVGIGITIVMRQDNTGADVKQVEPESGAKEAGILPGDILVAAEGQKLADVGVDGARDIIRGKEGTAVTVTLQRDGQLLELEVVRQKIQVVVAEGRMVQEGIGLVRIVNFNERCAQETIAQIEKLRQEGAQALIFDVRFNPGGYKDELVELLDYLLPAGEVFHSIYYNGSEQVEYSDEACLEMPFAVLINGESYSAAEFFAAALNEYDRAVVVGEPTVGKSYFQNTLEIGDGSAVALSVGKYLTPKGVALAEVGGLKPEVEVTVDEELAAKIYGQMIEDQDDPQLQAAIRALG